MTALDGPTVCTGDGPGDGEVEPDDGVGVGEDAEVGAFVGPAGPAGFPGDVTAGALLEPPPPHAMSVAAVASAQPKMTSRTFRMVGPS